MSIKQTIKLKKDEVPKMKMSKVDTLNVNLSKLGFGLMRLPRKNDEIDQEQVNEMVKYAYDNGVNYYDTAYVYNNGGSEIALGTALNFLGCISICFIFFHSSN